MFFFFCDVILCVATTPRVITSNEKKNVFLQNAKTRERKRHERSQKKKQKKQEEEKA